MKHLRKSECGVTIWQFVVVFPFFMLLVVVLIDFGRFSSLKGVIQEGVHQSLEAATTVPNLDVDPRGMPPIQVEYLRQKLARQKATDAGIDFINNVGLIYTKPDALLTGIDGPQLLDVEFTEDRIAGTPEQWRSKIAVLMPGECVFVPKLNLTECNRKTLGTTESDPPPVETPIRLIERHPVKVVAFATFDSFTPVLFSRPFRIEEYAYRQPIPQGPFPAFEDPGLLGAVGSPPSPGSNEPLGKPDLPPEPPISCVADWQRCIKESGTLPDNPGLVPAYWLPPIPDGRCDCAPAREKP